MRSSKNFCEKRVLMEKILLMYLFEFHFSYFNFENFGSKNIKFQGRKVRFKKVHEKVFSIKTRFSRKLFELSIVWPWILVRSKALIKADLLDTYNMFIRPTKIFYSHLKLDDFIKIALFQESPTWKLDFSRVPEFKNEQLLTFVAIKMNSRIVWSPRLFLRIAMDMKKCFRKNLNCKVISKFFTP